MTRKTSRFQPKKQTTVEYYYQVCDHDFRRDVCLQGDGYCFVTNPQKASIFLTKKEAEDFISRVKPPSPNNPLIIVEKQW